MTASNNNVYMNQLIRLLKVAVKYLERGIDILVPVSLIVIAILQIYPEYTFSATILDAIADTSEKKIFIAPVLLFCISISLKNFIVARRYLVDSWGFFAGFAAAISGVVLTILVLITERIDVLWLSVLLIVVWLVLRIMASASHSKLERVKQRAYELLVLAILCVALSFPMIFNVKYQLTTSEAKGLLKQFQSLGMPDNHPCFRSIYKAGANTLFNTFYFKEKFDIACSDYELATVIIDTAVKTDDHRMVALGLAMLQQYGKSNTTWVQYNELWGKILSLTETAVTNNDQACFDDGSLLLCIQPRLNANTNNDYKAQ